MAKTQVRQVGIGGLFTLLRRNLGLVRPGLVALSIAPRAFLRLVAFIFLRQRVGGSTAARLPDTAAMMRRARTAILFLRPSIADLEIAGYMLAKLNSRDQDAGLQFLGHAFINARRREGALAAFSSSSSGLSGLVAHFARSEEGKACRLAMIALLKRLHRQFGLNGYRSLAVLLAGNDREIASLFMEGDTFLRLLPPGASLARAHSEWAGRIGPKPSEAGYEIIVFDPMDLAEQKAGESEDRFEYIPYRLFKRNSKRHQAIAELVSHQARRLSSIVADHLLLDGVVREAFEIFLEKNALYRTILVHEKLEWTRQTADENPENEFVILVRNPAQYWLFCQYLNGLENISLLPFGDFELTAAVSEKIGDLDRTMTPARIHTAQKDVAAILSRFETLAKAFHKMLERQEPRSFAATDERPDPATSPADTAEPAGAIAAETQLAEDGSPTANAVEPMEAASPQAREALETLFEETGAFAETIGPGIDRETPPDEAEAEKRFIDRIGDYFAREEKAGNVLLQFNSKESLYINDVEHFLKAAANFDAPRIRIFDQRSLLAKGFLAGFPWLESYLRSATTEGRLIAGYKNLPLPSFHSASAMIYYVDFLVRRKNIRIDGEPNITSLVNLYFSLFLHSDIKTFYSLSMRARQVLNAFSVRQLVSFPGKDIYQIPMVAMARHMNIKTTDIECCAFGRLAFVPTHLADTVTAIDSIQEQIIQRYLKVPASRIRNAGCFNFHSSGETSRLIETPLESGYVLVLTQDRLLPTEFFDLLTIIENWHAETGKSVRVVLKPHPKENYRIDMYRKRAAELNIDVDVRTDITLEEAIAGAAIVAVKSSNSGLQAMQRGKPIIVLPGDDATLDFLEFGYGSRVASVADFDAVHEAARKGEMPRYLSRYHEENPWIAKRDTPRRILAAAGMKATDGQYE